uniref:Secreted protein n=1 Tax=Macrostomum lignano TaxID=282301 RepID=A0A1I8FHT5_9PLAT
MTERFSSQETSRLQIGILLVTTVVTRFVVHIRDDFYNKSWQKQLRRHLGHDAVLHLMVGPRLSEFYKR